MYSVDEIKDSVKKIILEIAEKNEMKVDENMYLMEDLEFSSLDILRLISDLEDEFNIQFDENDIENIVTVEDIIEYIKKSKAI